MRFAAIVQIEGSMPKQPRHLVLDIVECAVWAHGGKYMRQ
jgi:hypothetical protein